MRYQNLHPWKVTPGRALEIQDDLAKMVVLKKNFGQIRRIAGVDASYHLATNRIYSGIIIYSFPDLTMLEKRYASRRIDFPYVPGLLTFREGPALLAAFEKVKYAPDLIIFDGQGIAHPRGLGLASHMGILLNLPSIGCAKSRLVGQYLRPTNRVGAYACLKDGAKTIGAVLRTRKDVKPVFISPGFKIDLQSSIKIVLQCTRGYRLPEPTRLTHIFVEQIKRIRSGPKPRSGRDR